MKKFLEAYEEETARQQEIMGNYKVDRIFSEKLSGANTDRPHAHSQA